MKLTVAERWILANQYRILQALEREEMTLYQEAITILENGYEEYYAYTAQGLRQEPFPHEVASEVCDILEMFSHMQWAREKIVDDSILASPLFNFWGFDANHSHQHYEYAQFLHRMRKFRDIGDRLTRNSHSNTIETYRSMVEAWKQLPRKGLQMTQNDVQAILDAPKTKGLPMPEEGFSA